MTLAIIAFETREAMMMAAADRIAESLKTGLKARGLACAALSGGSTPERAYALLAQRTDWDWNKVTVALVDERFVPPSDDASNEKMIERALAPAFEAGAHFKPMYFATGTAREAADCANVLYEHLHIDIAVMGMGEDGHTASWFPGAEGLDAALDLSTPTPIVAVRAPKAAGAADRLTLTRRAIASADSAILLITGDAKRRKLEAAMTEQIEAAPVAALFAGPSRHAEIFWAP